MIKFQYNRNLMPLANLDKSHYARPLFLRSLVINNLCLNFQYSSNWLAYQTYHFMYSSIFQSHLLGILFFPHGTFLNSCTKNNNWTKTITIWPTHIHCPLHLARNVREEPWRTALGLYRHTSSGDDVTITVTSAEDGQGQPLGPKRVVMQGWNFHSKKGVGSARPLLFVWIMLYSLSYPWFSIGIVKSHPCWWEFRVFSSTSMWNGMARNDLHDPPDMLFRWNSFFEVNISHVLSRRTPNTFPSIF